MGIRKSGSGCNSHDARVLVKDLDRSRPGDVHVVVHDERSERRTADRQHYGTARLCSKRPGRGPPPQYRPQLVTFSNTEVPGTIIVHTDERFLNLIQSNYSAIRYTIGVGRQGFQWEGKVQITEKKERPDGRPPHEMIGRRSNLPRFVAGG